MEHISINSFRSRLFIKSKGNRHSEGEKIPENRIPSTNNIYESNYSKLSK